MILKTQHTEKSLPRLDLITSSFVIVYFAALFYPHKALGGGVLLDGKTIIELLVFSAFTLYATAKLSVKEPLLEKTPFFMPLAALTLLVVVASFFAQNRPIALEAFFLYLAYIGCFYIFLSLLKDSNQHVSLVYIIICIAVALSLWGLMQYYLLNLNPRLTSIWRLRATFGNSNQMAGFLAMTIPLFLGVILTRKFSGKVLLSLWTTMVLMLAAQLFTYARGGWIATSAGVSFILVTQFAVRKNLSKKVILGALPVVLILATLFISSTDLVNRFNTITQEDTEVTLYGRKLAWQGTIDMIKANPLTGVGPGNYSKAFRTFQPPGLTEPYMYAHSDYLHFISETGVLLIPIIIWLLFCLFKHGLEKIQHADLQMGGITLGAMGGIIAILVYSVSDFNLHIPANALLFTVLAAIVAVPTSQYVVSNVHIAHGKNFCESV
ncbi:MAG: O-antigen ligase domain-containing protein [Desulfobulbaceae bacterium]|nr:O-antigen ligase domain-containing protein [Desulfobulbaceae bacterium]